MIKYAFNAWCVLSTLNLICAVAIPSWGGFMIYCSTRTHHTYGTLGVAILLTQGCVLFVRLFAARGLTVVSRGATRRVTTGKPRS